MVVKTAVLQRIRSRPPAEVDQSAAAYHAVVEREDADVAAAVDVVAPHDRVRVVLHPDAGERVPTDLVVLVHPLSTDRRRQQTTAVSARSPAGGSGKTGLGHIGNSELQADNLTALLVNSIH